MNSQTPSANAAVVDLNDPIARRRVAAEILRRIDAWCVAEYDDGHRKHLGASLIGRPCGRYLWYVFRWVKAAKFDGRMHRLFQRGHREEATFIKMLQGIGCNVVNFTADGKQMRIEGVMGHYGGSLDGAVQLPTDMGIPLFFINEYKTQSAKKFQTLKMQGVQIAKPEHYAQMSIYGEKNNVQFAMYMSVCKDNDELHIEIVKLDWALAQRLEAKAQSIILSPTPPQKLSESIAFKECSYCDMKDVCHQMAAYEKNCRSCQYAQPVENKQWLCTGYNAIIPDEVIRVGCDNWKEAR